MNKIKYSTLLLSSLAFALLISCSQTDYPTFDPTISEIYFMQDSAHYSFGLTPPTVTEKIIKLPVRIMGEKSKNTREFKIEIIPEKTNVTANTHYSIPDKLVIEADSVNGIIPVRLYRDNLGNENIWEIAFRLTSNADFLPSTEVGDNKGIESVLTFTNIITQPDWGLDWQGNPLWMNSELGPWHPTKWLMFITFYHEMEEKAPATYKNMVDHFGENFETYEGWFYPYEYTVKHYILIPVYDYFQQHPELGITDMPNPND